MKWSKQIEILYEDDRLVALNKPPGVLSIPDRFSPDKPNMHALLGARYERAWVVHRLDRETSGVICFALDAEAHRHLSLQFETRRARKYYLALVDGLPRPPDGEIDKPIGPHLTQPGKMALTAKGKPALTLYRVLDTFRQFALVEADIRTGRTHQIRVHFAAIGHALAVDPLYGRREALYLSEIKGARYRLGKDQEEQPLMRRVTLHAHRLELLHPDGQTTLRVEAPPPKDFAALLKQLEKWGR
jgi:23S rRNA pseudouridine955/2504/2580 synthase/23S rRNA pseudouridine1911/1915/1917 synthase